MPVRGEADVEKVLKLQLILSTLFLTPVLLLFAYLFIPQYFCFGPVTESVESNKVQIECLKDNASTWVKRLLIYARHTNNQKIVVLNISDLN